jgi:hypothetical protein
LFFWKIFIPISIVIVQVYISTKSVWGLIYPASSLTFVVFCLLNDCHSYWCEMESQCSLICIYFMTKDVEHIFMCLLVICISSSQNYLFNLFPHLLSGLFVLLLFSFLSYLYTLGISGDFLNRTRVVQEIRERIDNWDYVKLQSFCTSKETTTRIKRWHREWEKYMLAAQWTRD